MAAELKVHVCCFNGTSLSVPVGLEGVRVALLDAWRQAFGVGAKVDDFDLVSAPRTAKRRDGQVINACVKEVDARKIDQALRESGKLSWLYHLESLEFVAWACVYKRNTQHVFMLYAIMPETKHKEPWPNALHFNKLDKLVQTLHTPHVDVEFILTCYTTNAKHKLHEALSNMGCEVGAYQSGIARLINAIADPTFEANGSRGVWAVAALEGIGG